MRDSKRNTKPSHPWIPNRFHLFFFTLSVSQHPNSRKLGFFFSIIVNLMLFLGGGGGGGGWVGEEGFDFKFYGSKIFCPII